MGASSALIESMSGDLRRGILKRLWHIFSRRRGAMATLGDRAPRLTK